MKNSLWQKRIPTLLGIILIIVGIGITTYLAGNGAIITTKAGPSEVPQNVRITNITDTSLTVSYTTDAQVIGSVNYGRDKSLGQITLDDRDDNGNISPRFIHYITLKNLNPGTTYLFSITSGAQSYLKDENPYEVSTGPAIGNSIDEANLIKGSVVYPQLYSKEAVVYITSEGSNTISTLAKDDGSYSSLLNMLRDKDLSSYFGFNENTVFSMLVVGQETTSNIKFTIPSEKILPPITLSEDFDFIQGKSETATQSAQEGFSALTFQTETPVTIPQIITPEDNQNFVDFQPRFTGTATPNSIIDIEIHSDDNLKAQVFVDPRGNWSYRPPTSLSPGQHTIKIIARDSSGILRTVSSVFMIFQMGTQVVEAATPSASPVPTIPPVVNPSPTPTSAPILIPTSTPTPISTSTPAPTMSPITTISPTPIPIITPPGNSLTLFGIIGIGITGLGALILLYNRGTPL